MSLVLATPNSNAIRTYHNGVKVIRLSEYMGAARGTLTTVTDADSPAVTVVSETQSLPLATTQADRSGSVSDTIVIPIADINDFSTTDVFYLGYMGIKVSGRPPVGGRKGEVWNSQSASWGPTIARLHDSTFYSSYIIPREFYSGYTLIYMGSFGKSVWGTITNLKFRAYGIDGGSMEFRVDLLYLIPASLDSVDESGTAQIGSFSPLYLSTGGAPDPDEDQDTNNSINTAHSVNQYDTRESAWEDTVALDLQESAVEKTLVDWNNIYSSDPTGEHSYIYIPVGSRLINYHTIEDEDFAAWSGTTPGTSSGETSQGYVIESGTTTFPGLNTAHGGSYSPHFYLMNSTLQFLGPGADSGIGVLPLSVKGRAEWSMGAMTVRPTPVSGGGASDPRNGAPLLQGFDSILQLYKVNLMMGHAGGDVEVHFGAGRWSAVDTAHQDRVTVTAAVIHHEDGTHDMTFHTTAVNGVDQEFGTKATNVMSGLAPGDSYWVRVEKRYNHWRARCWIDGDTEPETWDIEEFAPAIVTATTGGAQIVEHPYDVNWPSDVTNIQEDPTYWHGAAAGYTPWMHEAKVYLTAGFSTTNYELQIDQFKLEYDPDYPDGNGSHTGAYLSLEKYDGTENWGQVYIPNGSWRIVMGGYAKHHFSNDTHGGNVRIWKEAGAHPLQVAAMSAVRFRRLGPIGGPIHLDMTFRAYQEGDA